MAKTPMLKVSFFDPTTPVTAILPPGDYSFEVFVMDKWGAKAVYTVPDKANSSAAQIVNVKAPTPEQMAEFVASGKLEELQVPPPPNTSPRCTECLVSSGQRRLCHDDDDPLGQGRHRPGTTGYARERHGGRRGDDVGG